MDNIGFQVLSLNVRGIRDYKKNRKILSWLLKHNGDKGISFLQETHSIFEDENKWQLTTKSELIMSHGTRNSRGTTIIFGNKLDYRINEKVVDKKGRYVIVAAEVQGKQFLFINSYLPNHENGQLSVINSVVEIVSTLDISLETSVIWGG